jgi:hypothetical protein
MPRPAQRTIVSVLAVGLVLAWMPSSPAPVRAAGSITAVAFDSDPGDWIGAGQQYEYVAPASTITATTSSPGRVSVHIDGPLGEWWNIDLGAAGADPLVIGTYEDANRLGDATHPRLDVYGQGRGCGSDTGRFVVSELERDGGGNITSLAASFEEHCEGGTPALFGEVRVAAVNGYKLLTVSPTAIDLGPAGVGQSSAKQAVTVTSTGNAGVSLSAISIGGADPGDFAIDSETCPAVLAPDGTCLVKVKATPSTFGSREATLVIDNDTGRGLHTVGLTATGVTPVSAVAWGATRPGPSYSYEFGSSLTRSVNGTTAYLHASYTTDRVGGTWVDDNGPYAGINYIRTSNSGATFTTPRRLNPSTQHGSRGSLASSGKYIYATWVSTSRWIAYKGTAPRVLYLRRNSSHGASTSWNSIKRLTSLSGRVDFPIVAAAGANVYVVYTDSSTGSIKLKVSRDRAATWSTITLGSTAYSTTSGRIGVPHIAASGNTLVVAWRANSAGAIRSRVSLDAGKTWTAIAVLTEASRDKPAVAALGTRVAVAWANGSGAVVRTWAAGSWSAPSAVVPPTGATYTDTYGPAVALSGGTGLAVAWTGCVTACTTWSPSTRADLIWSESNDSAATWFAGQVIGPSGAYVSRRYNDYPTIIWASPTVRNVLWNAGTAGTNYYKVVLRTGAGVVAASSTTTELPLVVPSPSDSGSPIVAPSRHRPGG